ncbi:MAG: hypothetical protein DMG65_03595 [Candidatus Angelobacter sp. Gp1-AA117]|nr:MAG: hypothetical protein DMG65_03595 [Candidatus Angelobacter sp. Gp1-AA117]
MVLPFRKQLPAIPRPNNNEQIRNPGTNARVHLPWPAKPAKTAKKSKLDRKSISRSPINEDSREGIALATKSQGKKRCSNELWAAA